MKAYRWEIVNNHIKGYNSQRAVNFEDGCILMEYKLLSLNEAFELMVPAKEPLYMDNFHYNAKTNSFMVITPPEYDGESPYLINPDTAKFRKSHSRKWPEWKSCVNDNLMFQDETHMFDAICGMLYINMEDGVLIGTKTSSLTSLNMLKLKGDKKINKKVKNKRGIKNFREKMYLKDLFYDYPLNFTVKFQYGFYWDGEEFKMLPEIKKYIEKANRVS